MKEFWRMESPHIFDMFCGGGGSSRGALMAGATPVAALDMWKLAADTYRLNFPDATVYRMKASSLSPHRVLEDVGGIDLLLASPECTNHSVAKGNKPRCEKSRATAFEVIRFAKVLRPRWIVVENVTQMRLPVAGSTVADRYHARPLLGREAKRTQSRNANACRVKSEPERHPVCRVENRTRRA